MLSTLYKLPMFRGRNRLLRIIDQCLGPRTRVARFGVKLSTYLASSQDASFFERDENEHNSILVDAIKSLPKDGVFLDCGSNCGFYSALAAKGLGPKGLVISVEPSYREYARLISAVAANSHSCGWLTVNAGAGESPGTLQLDTQIGHTGMNRITKDATVGQTCPVFPIDVLVKMLLGDRHQVELVKIDVEGFEMDVLKGMETVLKEKKVGKLVVEITDKFLKQCGSSRDELYGFLKDMNYEPQVTSDEWQYDQLFLPNRD